MKNKTKKGFTLVEIMIVVVIIGLLAAMAIPAFSKVRENSIGATLDNDARQLASAANQYFLENSVNTVTVGVLVDGPAGDGVDAYLSGLSSGVIIDDATVLAQGAPFDLTHPNYDDGAAVSYLVDTGRRQEAAEEE